MSDVDITDTEREILDNLSEVLVKGGTLVLQISAGGIPGGVARVALLYLIGAGGMKYAAGKLDDFVAHAKRVHDYGLSMMPNAPGAKA